MEVVEEIVIVGGGVAGLATSLGLYRLGFRSLVLESSDDLRSAGYALTAFSNAWKALDALGIGDFMRQHHKRLQGNVTTSAISGLQTSELPFKANGKHGDHELRCVRRKMLLEALAKDLPNGTIRFSSKVVCIEESGFFKLVHLADGTILKAKVLVGCDGVNSVVAKWLGFKKPAFAGRFAVRGYVDFKGSSHGLEPKFMQFFGKGIRSGAIPVDDSTVYWHVTWAPSSKEEEQVQDPAKIKQILLSRLGKVPDKVRALIENAELDGFVPWPLRYRYPWELLWGNISKGNVCVTGDALHPLTPDIGQGACCALEDGVVLARCLAEALSKEATEKTEEKDEYKRIEMGLKKYAKERTWRSIELISVSYMTGFIQESRGKVINFLRDKALVGFVAGLMLKMADFDCGKLNIS